MGSTAQDTGKTNYHSHALTRGLQVLEIVASGSEPSTLTDVHEVSGLPKSTIVRLTSALTESGYLVRVDERPSYRLGHKVLGLAQGYFHSLDIVELVRPTLTAVAETTGHTVNLGILDDVHVVHLAVEMPTRPLRFDTAVGSRADTYCTGLGKTLLAALPPDHVADHLPPSPWPDITPARHTGPETLLADLETIRARGYALDDNEFAVGLTCLAVPLVAEGETIAALSVSGPSGEFGDAQVARNLASLQAAVAELAALPDVVAVIKAATHRGQ